MGWSAKIQLHKQVARSYITIQSLYDMTKKFIKNGLVRYFLNNKQVTETQYKETFMLIYFLTK